MIPDNFSEKYEHAMQITSACDAAVYLDACIEHSMRLRACDRKEAEYIERENILYWAIVYHPLLTDRVRALFHTRKPELAKTHPIDDKERSVV